MHIDPVSLFGNRGRRAGAAREALQLHHDSGDPFALYLSRWEPITISYGDEARYMAYGEDSQAPEPIADKLGRYLLEFGIPLLMVADDRDVASMASWIPALHLPDSEWNREVHALIRRADLIFIQMLLTTSAGLESEFELIRAESKESISVVLLPTFGQAESIMQLSPLKKDDAFFRGFDRVLYTHELFPQALLEMEETGDIIMRMLAIASLPKADRSRLADPKVRVAEFPLPSQT